MATKTCMECGAPLEGRRSVCPECRDAARAEAPRAEAPAEAGPPSRRTTWIQLAVLAGVLVVGAPLVLLANRPARPGPPSKLAKLIDASGLGSAKGRAIFKVALFLVVVPVGVALGRRRRARLEAERRAAEVEAARPQEPPRRLPRREPARPRR